MFFLKALKTAPPSAVTAEVTNIYLAVRERVYAHVDAYYVRMMIRKNEWSICLTARHKSAEHFTLDDI